LSAVLQAHEFLTRNSYAEGVYGTGCRLSVRRL